MRKGLQMRAWTRGKGVRTSGGERDALRGTLEYRDCISRDVIRSSKWILAILVYLRLDKVARLVIKQSSRKSSFGLQKENVNKSGCFL